MSKYIALLIIKMFWIYGLFIPEAGAGWNAFFYASRFYRYYVWRLKQKTIFQYQRTGNALNSPSRRKSRALSRYEVNNNNTSSRGKRTGNKIWWNL